MALILWAIDVPHMPLQRDAIMRIGANPQNRIKYGLLSEIRLHEKGITSNRE